jgi:hypothetical protein
VDDQITRRRVPERKTTHELAEELRYAPLANLRGRVKSPRSRALVHRLAEEYPRKPRDGGTNTKTYTQSKTRPALELAIAAFVAELLAAQADDQRAGWLRCSINKEQFTGKAVAYRQFDNVRKAWIAAGLIETVIGYPGMLAFGNPGPGRGRMTRFRAKPKLLSIAAEHGIAPGNVYEHFHVEFEMPSELVQRTSPSMITPNTERTAKLRNMVAELNAFFSLFTLEHPTIRHLGWVRKFHLGTHPDFRWNKGGRLYSQPPMKPLNYQNADEKTRLAMRIDDEAVAEIDISSSYLRIFYAWHDQQLDLDEDAYAGILGPDPIDREVAKFWINASFGNSGLLGQWSKGLKEDFERRMQRKNIEPTKLDTKKYRISDVRKKILAKHPLLSNWGDKVRGRIRDYGDLMFKESEIILSTMQVLMNEHRVPSMPVHDSIIVPASKRNLAADVLRQTFRKETGAEPKLTIDVSGDDKGWDF